MTKSKHHVYKRDTLFKFLARYKKNTPRWYFAIILACFYTAGLFAISTIDPEKDYVKLHYIFPVMFVIFGLGIAKKLVIREFGNPS